jgi:hypothetical protein
MYRIHWNIEVFRRTAKQYLGLNDCQMKAIEKKHQHVLLVMHAYARASIQANLMNLSCVEEAIKHHRVVKRKQCDKPLVATGQSLC